MQFRIEYKGLLLRNNQYGASGNLIVNATRQCHCCQRQYHYKKVMQFVYHNSLELLFLVL